MTPDSEGLHPIANTEKPDRKADIVFVHGLGGGPHSTWRHGKVGEPGHFFWPQELAQSLPDCGVWSLGHESGLTHWFSEQGMAIEDRAANFALKLTNRNFGQRPIVFITHSMGGLVVKEFVTAAVGLGGKDWSNVAAAVRGIVFLGTPHHGAHMATVAKGFAILLRTQEHLKQMKFASPSLDQLHKRFKKWQGDQKCSVESYVETRGIARYGRLGRFFPRVLVVPRISGDPNLSDSACHPIGADHITLVKPDGRSHDVFGGVLSFIEKVLKNTTPVIPAYIAALPPVQSTAIYAAPPAKNSGIRADISRIFKYAPAELIGREDETKLLNEAWTKAQNNDKGRPHILIFVALGGEGKTSLVAKWAAEMAHQHWPGCNAAFAWSFYSQGTRDQVAASSDLFLKEAITFFGDDADKEFAASSAGAYEKGHRLSRIVGQRHCLLILDGLEPLQYAPTSPTPGELKDDGIRALLRSLATASHGLCVITTRYSLTNLKTFWQTTAREKPLVRLSNEAGVHLLKTLGVIGTSKEFVTLVEDVKGHALTLTLLGGFLKRAFHGDIRQRDRVKYEKADALMDGGHAFRTMAAYEQWLLRDGGNEGRREMAVLQLMGLFDRPTDANCLTALRNKPILGLTEPLDGLADDDWEFCLSGLEAAKLLTVNRDSSGALISLDTHPHLRGYFAKQLREQHPGVWCAAHRRIYEHLSTTTEEGDQPTLGDLQPLYQAVAHGCHAGLQQETCDNIYEKRIQKWNKYYSIRVLGAVGADLGAVACFFDTPWKKVSSSLNEKTQAHILSCAANWLRLLGRLSEAIEPMQTGQEKIIEQKNWRQAANNGTNLSNLNLTLGEVASAVMNAEQSLAFAIKKGDIDWLIGTRAYLGDALHQAGRRIEAEKWFREAEQMDVDGNPLYSLFGFQYCDLLLDIPERVTWQTILSFTPQTSTLKPAISSCHAVSERATKTLIWAKHSAQDAFSIALDQLTLGRSALFVAILEKTRTRNQKIDTRIATSELNAAVAGLRRSNNTDDLPRAFLARAWLRFINGTRVGPESTQEDLDEAWEIAERGPMKLHMADIHLYRARLFFREAKYPWQSPQHDLAEAEKLINSCGYHRRDAELADAKQAILGAKQ